MELWYEVHEMATTNEIISGGERSDAVVRLKLLWTIDSCHYNNIIIPNTLIAIIIIII